MTNLKDAFRKQLMGEANVPGVSQTDAVKKIAKKQNSEAMKDVDKAMKDYEKPLKSGEDTTVKFPMTDKEKKEVHDTQELRGGMEDLEYMNEPNESFKDRAKKAIEGDSTMGNGQGENEEYGNTEPAWGASDANIGKNIVKNAEKRKKQKDAATPDLISFGNDIEISDKKTPKKKIAVESESKINEGFSEKGIITVKKWVSELGAREAAIKIIDSIIGKATGLSSSDFPDTMTLADGLDKLESQLSAEKYDAAAKTAKATVKKMFKENGGIYESSNNNTNNNNTMKPVRRTFKKSFQEIGNPLNLIPESFKVDNYEFELSDGNETYRMRWEGDINEGQAIILRAQNKTQINEDMAKIKHLMGYSSKDALGMLRGNDRINENTEFINVWNKTVQMLDESQETKGEVISENVKPINGKTVNLTETAKWFEKIAGVKIDENEEK
jgi:hypothetical protein